MITPIFSLSQTDPSVILRIRLPYVKVSAAELNVDKFTVTFHLQPYFLRLILENEMVSEGVQSAVYNHNDSYLTVSIGKKNAGEHFKNLEMITTLLQTSKKRDNLPQIPKIEMISSQNGEVNDDEKEMIDQLSDLKLNQFTYGFQGKFSGIFSDLKVR